MLNRTCQKIAMWLAPAAIAFHGSLVSAQWLTPSRISNTPARWDNDASMDFDAAGKVHMVWQEWDDYGYGATFYSNNVGSYWLPPQLLAGSSGKAAGGPRLVITPDQTIHVLYALQCCDNGIFYISKPVSGGAWTDPVRVDASPMGRYLSGAARDASGGVYMIWLNLTSGTAGLYGRYKPAGGSWGSTEAIDVTGDANNFPQDNWVGTHGNDFYVTFFRTGDRVLKYRKRSVGGSWAAPVVLSSPGGYGRLAWSWTGEMAAAWHQDVDGNSSGQWYEVFVKFSSNDGATWTSPFNVSNKVSLDRNPEMCYEASGNLHILWQGFNCDGCQPDLYYRARISGAWTLGANITNSPYRTGLAANAVRALGNVLYLVYTDTDSTLFEDIYLMTNPQTSGGGTGTIGGTVRDQFGAAVANIQLSTPQGYAAVSGSDGRYSLIAPAGTYNVTAGKIYYNPQTINGIVVTLNGNTARDFTISGQPPLPVTSASTVGGSTRVQLSWTNSASANTNSVIVRYSTTGYPQNPSDGTLLVSQAVVPSSADSYTHTDLTNGRQYYYAIFACFADANNYCASSPLVADIPHLSPDLDRDGDVDMEDFGVLQKCLTGAFNPQNDPACLPARLDADDDVDSDDVVIFQNCFHGPGVYAPVNCAGGPLGTQEAFNAE